jgi:sulfur-oxidizing protein SoxA
MANPLSADRRAFPRVEVSPLGSAVRRALMRPTITTTRVRSAAIAAFVLAGLAIGEIGHVSAQNPATPRDYSANPGFHNVDRGEVIWRTPRGGRQKSLEDCDLGLGPGVLRAAYAHLPRYFADSDKVMDLEQRLLWCMAEVQGHDTSQLATRPFGPVGQASEMEDLVAFVANQSSGATMQPSATHPKEQEAIKIGETLFFRRSGVMDFACASCHVSGNRIRFVNVPKLDEAGSDARKTMGSWPVYGFPQRTIRTLQFRLWDCYRTMRMPAPAYASDAVTALIMFLTYNAEGATVQVPGIKR